MKLGFAVKILGRDDLPSHDTRRWQSHPNLATSIGYLQRIFEYLDSIDVRLYRMASGIAPYASHPELVHFRDQPQKFASELESLGARARRLGLRLSTHPGQYTVLNSQNDATVDAAKTELEVHSEIMDAMGLGHESVIVIHVGGAAGGKKEAKDRFESSFASLPPYAQRRVAVENDDRSFSVGDVLELSSRTGCPVVWDVLHHHCYDPDGMADDEALRLATGTWPSGVVPKIHYSTPRTSLGQRTKKIGRKKVIVHVPPQLKAHADMIDPIGFEWFLRNIVRDREIDIMLEAKGKDVALLELRRHLHSRGLHPEQPPGEALPRLVTPPLVASDEQRP